VLTAVAVSPVIMAGRVIFVSPSSAEDEVTPVLLAPT
jgi:ABC-type branched-subunit amino acid transport system substrate-binding protein